MFDYLQQFNNLPKEVRGMVSGTAVMAALADLEKKYQVDLAMAVMKVMIKSLAVSDLPSYFTSEFNLDRTQAENLAKDLMAKIFINAAAYLGLEKQIKALDLEADINIIITEAELTLPSDYLINRFKSVLSTYLKGIRSKIAARDTMSKPVNLGGLNLSAPEIDRVFKVCEQKTFKSLEVNLAMVSKLAAPQSRLDKIIASAEASAGGEYNLKQALASGQIKKLDTSHELRAPEKELNLPLTTVAKPVATPAPVVAVAPQKPVVSDQTKKTDVPAQKISKPEIKSSPFNFISRKPAPIATAPATPPIAAPSAPLPKPVAAARPTFSASPSKQTMHDIKPMPKVMGPLEELQFLDLLNFRRLGKTPTEVTAKIFSKIKLLEEDGYDKMVAGVMAWRQSPINRQYLKMVQTAMSKGIKLKDFALTAEKENKDNLSLEEIEAILEMNSKLVF